MLTSDEVTSGNHFYPVNPAFVAEVNKYSIQYLIV